MGYKLGKTSKARLKGVHPKLVAVVERAIEVTQQDFTVNEGLRTLARQKQLVAKGASQTLNSKHLPQEDGFGHAVDIVPYGDFNGDGKGEISWDWQYFYELARAMREAAKELNVLVRWGGCWKVLNYTTDTPKKLVQDYTATRRAGGRKAFTDGPHFEIILE